MKFGLRCLTGTAISLAIQAASLARTGEAAATSALTSSNPYSVIIDRNVFHLNPPPVIPPAEKSPPPDLPDVYLSGFMRTGGKLEVLLVVKAKHANSSALGSASYLTLAQGDKQETGLADERGMIELVKADVESQEVNIINCGTPVTLSVKDNGLEHQASALPAKVGGAPGVIRDFRNSAGMTPAMEMRATRQREDLARMERENAGAMAPSGQ